MEKENNKKIILDLCGGTGAWSKPYRDAGYDVRVITLPEYNVTATAFVDNYIHFESTKDTMVIDTEKVYGVLAAPPCTEFSLAKSTKPRDFKKGIVVVRACVEIIWACRLGNKIAFWAIENPRGFLRQFLGKPAFTFEQWEFGDEGIKPTDLWGYFNEPRKTETDRSNRKSVKYPNGRHNAVGWSRSAEKRAITPQGFANAFYKANQ